jgi:nucleotide-binding universal stress UspA family protein
MHSLDPIGDSLKTLGISVTTTVHEPSPRSQEPPDPSHIAVTPAQHIVEEAGKDSDTLIVMGTHGRSGIGHWVMGSVTDKVLHATANPLMIVRC